MSEAVLREPAVSGAASALNAEALARDDARSRQLLMLLAVPAVLVVLIAMIIPIAWTLFLSFVGPDGRPTLDHYRILFSEGANVSVVLTTLKVSGLVTLLAVLIGYPLTYLMAQLSPRWTVVFLVAVILPYLTSVLVRTYAWVVLLGRRGLVNNALVGAGFIEFPIQLLYNTTATVIGMVHYMLPLLVLPLYASMRSIDPNYVRAASGLGATPTVAFWKVFFPLSVPGLAGGAFLIFVISLGFFITPAILGGGRVTMVAQQIATATTTHSSFGVASALGIVLLVTTSALLLLAAFGLKLDVGRARE